MKLYGDRNGRTLRALWALEEVHASYEYIEIDLFAGESDTFVPEAESCWQGASSH
jgi:hypothetical protein